MATAGWRGARSLNDLLREEPQRFEALQAIRLLETMAGRPGAVRYRGSLGSSFPASDIDRLELPSGAGAPAELTANFLALAGAFGPLPRPLAEAVAVAARRKDMAGRDFLDLFNHRLIGLLVQLRRRTRPAAEALAPDATRLAAWLFALLGLETPGLRRTERMQGLDRGLPFLAGVLARRPLGLHAVERLLVHHFGVPVRITPFRGRWLPLDEDQATVLGRAGRNCQLGNGALLGRRFWDQAAGLRVTMGPLQSGSFAGLLPGGVGWSQLRVLLAFALDHVFAIELVLLPAADAAKATRLGRSAPRLGWTTWLGTSRSPAPARLGLPEGGLG